MRGSIRGAIAPVVMLLVTTVLAVLLAPTGQAGAAPPYPPSQCPTVSIDHTQVSPGGTIIVTGINFPAGSTVELRLDPSSLNIRLGSTRVGSDGSFSITITFPDVSAGPHFIFAVDGERLSCPADPRARVFAVDAGNASQGPSPTTSPAAAGVVTTGTATGTGGVLSSTGVDIAIGLIMGLALILAGVLLLRGGRRRRSWSGRGPQRAPA